MAGLPPGGLKSTTAEGQFLELAEYLNRLQRDSATNPQNRAIFIEYGRNNLNDTVTIKAVLPVTAITALTGATVLTAQSVFSSPT